MLLCMSISAFSQTEISTDWPQFRGADRSGKSSEKITNADWTKNAPDLVWKKNIGSAFSEMTVVDNIVYTMLSEQTDSISGFEYIAAFDAENGKELWKTKIDSLFIDADEWGNGPHSTLAVDDKNAYGLSAFGKFTAVSKKNGKVQWTVDFVKEFGSTPPRWAFSSSPLLIDGVVVMEVGGKESKAFAAFDKKNGKTVWIKGEGGSTYSSPIKANIDGQEQIIFANGNKFYSFNTKGDTLWSYTTPLRSPTAAIVFIEPNTLFASQVGATGGFAVKMENGKGTEVFKSPSMKNDWSSSCYHDGYIYGFNVASLQCISAKTGEKKWSKRGFGKGSLIMVDDKLFVLSDKGKLILVDANPDAYTELGSIQALKGKSWTAPSFSNGKVFLRNLTEMACYKVNK